MKNFILWIIATVLWSVIIGGIVGVSVGAAYNAVASAYGIPNIEEYAFTNLFCSIIFVHNVWGTKIKPFCGDTEENDGNKKRNRRK